MSKILQKLEQDSIKTLVIDDSVMANTIMMALSPTYDKWLMFSSPKATENPQPTSQARPTTYT